MKGCVSTLINLRRHSKATTHITKIPKANIMMIAGDMMRNVILDDVG